MYILHHRERLPEKAIPPLLNLANDDESIDLDHAHISP